LEHLADSLGPAIEDYRNMPWSPADGEPAEADLVAARVRADDASRSLRNNAIGFGLGCAVTLIVVVVLIFGSTQHA
jgi:hypothetical protein